VREKSKLQKPSDKVSENMQEQTIQSKIDNQIISSKTKHTMPIHLLIIIQIPIVT